MAAPSFEAGLTRSWLRRGATACALWPLSLLFRLLVALRRTAFRVGILRSTRLPVPVVVVGNIFVGGTGKTPFSIWLIQAMRGAGFTPGVISRGHGGKHDAPQPVEAGSDPAQVGDEPVLIARHTGCPLVVGRNRVAAARLLLERHPEVDLIVSDDGLQHYALRRDVEIVLCDERGNGNGWMLPAGPLREPASRRRDFTVVNGVGDPQRVAFPFVRMRLAGARAERLGNPDDAVALKALRGERIAAAAGIGNPARFFAMLRAAGVNLSIELPLPDHYDFVENPFAAVPADLVLITEKDAVKCLQRESIINDPRIRVVPVAAQLDDALAQQIVEKCRGRATA